METKTKTCECCGEREVGDLGREHGYDYCDECCTTNICERETCDRECESHYLWESALCKSCAAEAELDLVWDAAKNALSDAGLWVCGTSNKSRSTYFGRGSDSDGYQRIRLSNHAVAYACSDCAVCIEIGRGSPDADVTISDSADTAEVEKAISEAIKLFEARCPERDEEENE